MESKYTSDTKKLSYGKINLYMNCFFFKYINLLNHVENKVLLQTTFTVILAFIIVHVPLMTFLISPYGFKFHLLSSVLSFHLSGLT